MGIIMSTMFCKKKSVIINTSIIPIHISDCISSNSNDVSLLSGVVKNYKNRESVAKNDKNYLLNKFLRKLHKYEISKHDFLT